MKNFNCPTILILSTLFMPGHFNLIYSQSDILENDSISFSINSNGAHWVAQNSGASYYYPKGTVKSTFYNMGLLLRGYTPQAVLKVSAQTYDSDIISGPLLGATVNSQSEFDKVWVVKKTTINSFYNESKKPNFNLLDTKWTSSLGIEISGST